MDDKVVVTTKYNYYKYYDMNKHIYRLNYLERQRKKELKAQEEKSNYYENYYKNLAKTYPSSDASKAVT